MARVQTELSADIPENWSYEEEEITLVSDGRDAVVVASSTPHPEEVDLREYAEGIGPGLAQTVPAYHEIALEEIELAEGRTGWLRRFESESAPGQRTVYLQTYDIRNGRVYTSTATTAAENFEQNRQELISILTSIDIDPRRGVEDANKQHDGIQASSPEETS